MKLSHVHLQVRDLPRTLVWLRDTWKIKPNFQNEHMAVVPLGPILMVFDASDRDAPATIGFDSKDCDADFRAVVQRGAEVIEEPADRPWGVRAAYLRGPGALTFEIEQPLSKKVRAVAR